MSCVRSSSFPAYSAWRGTIILVETSTLLTRVTTAFKSPEFQPTASAMFTRTCSSRVCSAIWFATAADRSSWLVMRDPPAAKWTEERSSGRFAFAFSVVPDGCCPGIGVVAGGDGFGVTAAAAEA